MNKVIYLCIFFCLASACQNDNPRKETTDEHTHQTVESYYTCSMHPQIKEKKAGKCPICHMNLTKVEIERDDEVSKNITVQEQTGDDEKTVWACRDYPDLTSEYEEICPIDGTKMIKLTKASRVVSKVKLRKSQLNHFHPEFFPVTTMKMIKHIRLLGTVLQSEEKESNIPARIGGRVEKVFVKSTGSLVKIGDPVVSLYSPKLITAGEEYLLARSTHGEGKEFTDILTQSEERLKLWGIKKFQYEKWYRDKKVPKQITIYSSAMGIVRKKNAMPGKYFKEGQNFLELSDLSDVWVELDVYEQDSAMVEMGQQIRLEFIALPGEIFSGEIDFISPVLNEKSRTLKVRTTIKNTHGKLKPGMIADANLKIKFKGMPLVVPRTAIIDTGKRKVVWTKITNKQYQAKEVFTGHESEGYVEIKEGLMKGESVVMDGSFLLDAQAQLFGGYENLGEHH